MFGSRPKEIILLDVWASLLLLPMLFICLAAYWSWNDPDLGRVGARLLVSPTIPVILMVIGIYCRYSIARFCTFAMCTVITAVSSVAFFISLYSYIYDDGIHDLTGVFLMILLGSFFFAGFLLLSHPVVKQRFLGSARDNK